MAAPTARNGSTPACIGPTASTGRSQGHYYVDCKTGEAHKSKSAYAHPQPHACFIQSIADDLVNDGGIMDLWVREARLFKYGSGTGSNFSKLRGEDEPLSGGGKSSGLMSFLKIGDRAAGAIKSGGTTRRAAKMVDPRSDHPDIEKFIDWKVIEEQKVANLVTGSKINQKHLRAIMKACVNCEGSGDDCFDPDKNPVLRREIKAARRSYVPDNYIKRVIQFAKQGYTDIAFPVYDADWDWEAYLTVSRQNSNNSVRITDEFLKAVEADSEWDSLAHSARQDRRHRESAPPVGEDRLCRLGQRGSRPAVSQHDQRLAHLPGVGTDPGIEPVLRIHVPRRYRLQSRVDELAGVSLRRSRTRRSGRAVRYRRVRDAVRLWTLVLEISVLMAQFPSREIAQLSYDFRTLGLGYANLGGLLMSTGLSYDSDAGRQIAGSLSAILTGVSYATSAEMAGLLGAFPGYKKNRRAHAARHPQPSAGSAW